MGHVLSTQSMYWAHGVCVKHMVEHMGHVLSTRDMCWAHGACVEHTGHVLSTQHMCWAHGACMKHTVCWAHSWAQGACVEHTVEQMGHMLIDWFDTEGDVVLDSADIVDDTTTDCVANDDQENDDENKI